MIIDIQRTDTGSNIQPGKAEGLPNPTDVSIEQCWGVISAGRTYQLPSNFEVLFFGKDLRSLETY